MSFVSLTGLLSFKNRTATVLISRVKQYWAQASVILCYDILFHVINIYIIYFFFQVRITCSCFRTSSIKQPTRLFKFNYLETQEMENIYDLQLQFCPLFWFFYQQYVSTQFHEISEIIIRHVFFPLET